MAVYYYKNLCVFCDHSVDDGPYVSLSGKDICKECWLEFGKLTPEKSVKEIEAWSVESNRRIIELQLKVKALEAENIQLRHDYRKVLNSRTVPFEDTE